MRHAPSLRLERLISRSAATSLQLCQAAGTDPRGSDYKARRSRETATDAARTGYLRDMLLGGGFADEFLCYATPTLVITGAHDADGFREADIRAKLGTAAAGSRFETIQEAGHYPMQEAPVRYAAL